MTALLDKIKLPETLKELSSKQLDQIADEVRKKIISITSKSGGHLASSLGAVELAVALHATFDSPVDKIIWDVGHQSYAHKLLTGRLDRFNTLRQHGGISGFPNAAESPHDPFTVGHASASISQALGLVKARDLNGEKHSVIAVIGDASLSGGLAFEGMNNAGGLKTNLIVILNDNEMAISKSVGAFSNYLTAVRTSNFYVDIVGRIEKLIRHFPRIGTSLFESAKKLKDRTRQIVLNFKVDVIFEELGFKYFGPINGHNIPLLMSTLHHAKDIEGPILIHVLTKKGKGYSHAEDDPTRFHGAPPYYIENGKSKTNGTGPTYTEIFGKTMLELAEQNPKVVAITAAMTDGTGLVEFAQKFPERFFDVGIAEEHAVTFAAGLAKGGFRPYVAIYSTFLQRAYDQIIHDVCLQNLPVVFAIDRAGIVGEDGATHNGAFDMAYLRAIPNMTVMAPKDEKEFQSMLHTASEYKGPVAIRYPRGSGYSAAKSSGTGSVCIIAIGSMVYPAIEAAKMFGDAFVVNARFVKPLDKKLILESVKNAKQIVTVEEGTIEGGFGSAVAELLEDEGIKIPVKRIGLPDQFIEHGARREILDLYGLSAEKICQTIKNL
ncbi:1-deoxy-D-xylulose-5-phosphate synthase [candidate division WOR-1 bacterium RIFOXYA12_FULL_43_27]|uniref:1-deoxy-D-xylulose-5-phosphate synthase n=1 Tax=candidate division WOR-1 bacterium RIFOXYC2_FULL_46_14 TaxID=1802587 RepID=A0A1F4U743_UNCSA|nr:MAG: 1-deoxy-D-xylulose-5-phosphate synthase [candidate division WOR-1 bacterium RIFOXYA12_FULL_43_27]OGC19195.1 MAG: 1-deoxy-D-xylulose-5-phosphate synthase [candidate division WOR-1 bacterium RIFOXYB2_FULL_46_45]OGC30184.1 MAG: 1-deoxy-D-xylulose-5-phosphate synthase [candidate division WOR-1 bacterium RIFOXYA2_FULL_46_56]OGC40786.1 MAG: 1-deoxy-D-xylulose-5-phosphate synthase [candidate division WOR-1 bacterium RIFOXYC2_FULL_46_14]